MQSQRGENLSPGRLKPPNIPPSLDEFDVNDLRHVLDILDAIRDITKDIVGESARDSTASPTLERVSELSKRLPKDILPFPGSTIPKFKVCLETYELILVDVRNRLIANQSQAAGSCDIFSRRLDLFIHEFEEKLDLHTIVSREPLLSTSAPSMFQNSRNFAIFGGIFNAIQVAPDVADQSHKILRILYIQCGFLFA